MTTTTNTAAVIYHDFNQFGMQDIDPCVVETVSPEKIKKAAMRRKINRRRNKVACFLAFFFAMMTTVSLTGFEVILIHALFNPSNYAFLGIGIIASMINILIGGFSYECIEERIYHKNRY